MKQGDLFGGSARWRRGLGLGVAIGLASPWAGLAFPASADPGGCRLERITDAPEGEGQFQFHGVSRDGAKLLVGWFRGKATGAFVLDLASGERRDLPGLHNGGVFSEDGTRVLVANTEADGTTEIVEVDLATNAQRAIAPHPKHDWLATYSPDGKWIGFNSYRSGKSDIYLVPRASGEPIRLTDFEGYEAEAEFSPDSRTILFHRQVAATDYDVYRIDLATSQVTPFITGPGEQSYAAWSPDGRQVAFSSDEGEETGKTDLYLADATATGATRHRRLTRHPGYNTYPTWSPDGRYLYFNSERDGRRNVYRLELKDAGAGGCVQAR